MKHLEDPIKIYSQLSILGHVQAEVGSNRPIICCMFPVSAHDKKDMSVA